MSTDEIRKLAESQALVNFCGKEHLDGEPCSECIYHSDGICQDNEAIKAALLAYADAVEENAKLKARLEAVVKVAEEQFDYIFHSPMCWDEDENESHSLEQLREMDALKKIVATVRGDAGKEEK